LDEVSDGANSSMPVEIEELRAILVRVVKRICPSWMANEREDLVQNACLRIVKKYSRTKEPTVLGTSYLWRVAHSAVMDEIRRRRRHPEVGMEEKVHLEPASALLSPEGERVRSELNAAITKGLAKLAEARRWAVLLYLYGFSLKDSARMLGWNAKRVDNQRYQGLGELRIYLKNRGLEP
jgi:RNA polymerase sigma-70 factor (ECF subfamily)